MMPRILVIEDNDIAMNLMIYVLNALGLTVIPALNGPAGLAIAKAELPDLIMCDIQMPHLDGHAVLDAVRTNPTISKTPVIAVTALSMVGDGERLLARGFDGYLSKPIEFNELKNELRKHLPAWPV